MCAQTQWKVFRAAARIWYPETCWHHRFAVLACAVGSSCFHLELLPGAGVELGHRSCVPMTSDGTCTRVFNDTVRKVLDSFYESVCDRAVTDINGADRIEHSTKEKVITKMRDIDFNAVLKQSFCYKIAKEISTRISQHQRLLHSRLHQRYKGVSPGHQPRELRQPLLKAIRRRLPQPLHLLLQHRLYACRLVPWSPLSSIWTARWPCSTRSLQNALSAPTTCRALLSTTRAKQTRGGALRVRATMW